MTISNLNLKLDKCSDLVINTCEIWGSGTLVQKQKLQKLMFPEGIMIDPVSRQYRTNKIQSLFSYIVDLTKDTEGQKKDSPIKNTDESSLVERIIELSDLKLGFVEVLEYLKME